MPVPVASVGEWTDVELTVDHLRLTASISYGQPADTMAHRVVVSLRRQPLVVGIWWGRRRDSEGEIWFPLLAPGPAPDPDLSSEQAQALLDAATQAAAELVLRGDPGPPGREASDPLVPAEELIAWATDVVAGSPPPLSQPWELGEVVGFLEYRAASGPEWGRPPWPPPGWPPVSPV